MDADLRRLSINTATLGFQWDLGQVIDAVAAAGIGGVAPWRRDLAAFPPAAAGRRARDAGLAVTSLCRASYFTHAEPTTRAAILDDNRRAIDEAALLGAPTLCCVVGGLPDGSRDLAGARAQVVDGLGALAGHAAAAGIRLAVEPLHPVYAADRSCVSTLASALDVCDAVGGGAGVIVDAYHVWWDPDLAPGLARAGADRLLGYQVSDWRVPLRDVLNDRAMMGDGVIDLTRLDRLMHEAGYAGHVEVEIFSEHDWWRRDPAETITACAGWFAQTAACAARDEESG